MLAHDEAQVNHRTFRGQRARPSSLSAVKRAFVKGLRVRIEVHTDLSLVDALAFRRELDAAISKLAANLDVIVEPDPRTPDK